MQGETSLIYKLPLKLDPGNAILVLELVPNLRLSDIFCRLTTSVDSTEHWHHHHNLTFGGSTSEFYMGPGAGHSCKLEEKDKTYLFHIDHV